MNHRDEERTPMKRLFVSLATGVVLLVSSQAPSQAPATPTPPKIKLEAFEPQEGGLVIQGFAKIADLPGAYGERDPSVS